MLPERGARSTRVLLWLRDGVSSLEHHMVRGGCLNQEHLCVI